MDFNVGKMAAVVFVIRDGLPHAVDEFVDVFDTPAMIEKIRLKYSDHAITVYPDASGKSRKTVGASESDLSLLKKAGLAVVVNASNPSVRDRINSKNAMLCNAYDERRLFVNIEKCPGYTQALERQVYDAAGDPDKTLGFDHLNDAGGYFIAKRYPIVKREAVARRIPGLI